MHDDSELTEGELRQRFLRAGESFFSWNGGKNTPNILIQLEERLASVEVAVTKTTEAIGTLDASVRAASASSTALAASLNKLTLWYTIVTGTGVLIAASALIWQVTK